MDRSTAAIRRRIGPPVCNGNTCSVSWCMVAVTEAVAEREAEAARLEAEMAEVCGVLNAATGRLVGLIARVLETGAWEGHGIRSAEHWVTWQAAFS